MANRVSTKKMFCPVCNRGRILDVSLRHQGGKIKVHKPEEADRADYFLKCGLCKSQIGISIIK